MKKTLRPTNPESITRTERGERERAGGRDGGGGGASDRERFSQRHVTRHQTETTIAGNAARQDAYNPTASAFMQGRREILQEKIFNLSTFWQ